MQTLGNLLKTAQQSPPCRLVVAGASHESTLNAVVSARRRELIDTATLIGDADTIESTLTHVDADPDDYRVVDAPDDAADRAAESIADGNGDVLLKGGVSSSNLLGAVLEHIPTSRRLSDVLITENPVGPAPKLIGVADGGVNVAPDLETKQQIIENSVEVFHQIGIDEPRVAVVCAVEKVLDQMPHTVDADKLATLGDDDRIDGCIVDGPLALDNALSLNAARAKGIDSPVAGRADILVAPSIEAGNILGKAFRYLAHRRLAHVIGGADVPILIPSRTESTADRLLSIALAVHCRKEST